MQVSKKQTSTALPHQRKTTYRHTNTRAPTGTRTGVYAQAHKSKPKMTHFSFSLSVSLTQTHTHGFLRVSGPRLLMIANRVVMLSYATRRTALTRQNLTLCFTRHRHREPKIFVYERPVGQGTCSQLFRLGIATFTYFITHTYMYVHSCASEGGCVSCESLTTTSEAQR